MGARAVLVGAFFAGDYLPDRGVQAAAMMATVLWAALVALFLAFTLLCPTARRTATISTLGYLCRRREVND